MIQKNIIASFCCRNRINCNYFTLYETLPLCEEEKNGPNVIPGLREAFSSKVIILKANRLFVATFLIRRNFQSFPLNTHLDSDESSKVIIVGFRFNLRGLERPPPRREFGPDPSASARYIGKNYNLNYFPPKNMTVYNFGCACVTLHHFRSLEVPVEPWILPVPSVRFTHSNRPAKLARP